VRIRALSLPKRTVPAERVTDEPLHPHCQGVNDPDAQPLWNRSLIVAPWLAILVGCTATVSGPADGVAGGPAGSSVGGSSQGGSAGGKATGGTGGAGAAAGGTGGSGVGGTSTGGDTGGPGPRPVSLVGAPLYSRFLRLTNDQWEHSVRDILRLSGPTGVSDGFLHAVSGTTDFDNNERVVFVDNTAASDFQLGAEALADQVTATDAALQSVVATTDVATFIKTLGRRAFRRDLTPAEVTDYQDIHSQGTTAVQGTQSAFTRGARWVISAMLQSPNFLYRIEMGDDGTPLSGYEMAAKLSLWIRDTTPTDALLDSASSLTTADAAASEAAQLLEDTAAKDVMQKFHSELYKFALYDSIAKTGVAGYTEALNPELKQASVMFFDRIFSSSLGVRDILTSTVGFAGPNMAKLYGLSVSGNAVTQVTMGDRVGYFSQPPFLALWARNNDPDSIHRGARINLDTLCADPGLPSATLPAIPAAAAGETNRMVITNLTSGCGAECHGQIINPVGFAFENFDGLGRFRDTDNGQPVDTAGEYPFVEGTQAFAGAPELMELMASGVQAHQCWAKKMASYALERDLVEADRPLIETLGAESQGAGASLKQVMVALVKQDAFRTRVGGAQ